MAIQTMVDVGIDFKVKREYDGAVYSLLGDCVIEGVGAEFSETHDDLTMTIASGEAVIGGNFFKLTNTENITLGANLTGFVCLSIDTTLINGSRGFLSFKTEQDIKKENINDAGTLRDLVLYAVSTSATDVEDVEDLRVIKEQALPSLKTINGDEIVGEGDINTFSGIDFDNIIAENQYDYTPTNDCWCQIFGGANVGTQQYFFIDDMQVTNKDYLAGDRHFVFYPIKAGQRVFITTSRTTLQPATNVSRFRFFGVKK